MICLGDVATIKRDFFILGGEKTRTNSPKQLVKKNGYGPDRRFFVDSPSLVRSLLRPVSPSFPSVPGPSLRSAAAWARPWAAPPGRPARTRPPVAAPWAKGLGEEDQESM